MNLARRLAIGDDNQVYAIHKLLDWEGDETDDPADARFAIVKIEESCWLTVDLKRYKVQTT